jgi:hypothetical protein
VVAKIMKPVFEIHVMLTVDQIFVLSWGFYDNN